MSADAGRDAARRPAGRRRLAALDWLAIAGGGINLLVVATIVVWWVAT